MSENQSFVVEKAHGNLRLFKFRYHFDHN